MPAPKPWKAAARASHYRDSFFFLLALCRKVLLDSFESYVKRGEDGGIVRLEQRQLVEWYIGASTATSRYALRLRAARVSERVAP